MQQPIAGLCLLAAGILTLGGCHSAAPPPADAKAATRPAAASPRSAAMAALETLEMKVADARKGLPAVTASVATLSRAERLHVSEVRRAIVAANVSLQKAREAMSGGKDEEAKQLLEAATARLSEVLNARPAASGPAGGSPQR